MSILITMFRYGKFIIIIMFSFLLFKNAFSLPAFEHENKIFGTVFVDINDNLTFDINEPGISKVRVILKTIKNSLRIVESNDFGYFEFNISDKLFRDEAPIFLELDPKTLPLGTKNLPIQARVLGWGETNVGVDYPRKVNTLLYPGKNDLKIEKEDLFINNIIHGSLREKEIKINNKPVEIPFIKINLIPNTVLPGDKIKGTLELNHIAKKINASRIETQGLYLSKETDEKIVFIEYKNIPYNFNFDLDLGLTSDKYKIHYFIKLKDKTEFYSNTQTIYFLKKPEKILDFDIEKINSYSLKNDPKNESELNKFFKKTNRSLNYKFQIEYNDSPELNENFLSGSQADLENKTTSLRNHRAGVELSTYLIKSGIEPDSIKIYSANLKNNNIIRMKIYNIKDDKHDTQINQSPLQWARINGRNVITDSLGRFIEGIDGNSPVNLSLRFADGSSVKTNILNYIKNMNLKSKTPFVFEEYSIKKTHHSSEFITVEHHGMLKTGSRLYVDEKIMPLDSKKEFRYKFPILYGDNVIKYSITTDDAINTAFKRTLSLFSPGKDKIYFSYVTPEKINTSSDEAKEEFIYGRTNSDYTVLLNNKVIPIKNGKFVALNNFGWGRNKLKFDIDNKHSYQSIESSEKISRDWDHRLSITFETGLASISTNASGKANQYRDYDANYWFLKPSLKISPFSFFSFSKKNEYLANLSASIYYQKGNINYPGINPLGDVEISTARPTYYGFKTYEFFKFKNFPDIRFAPLLKFENYNLNIEDRKLFRNASYKAIFFGACLETKIHALNLDSSISFEYPLYFNYRETPEITGLGIGSKSYYNILFDLKYIISYHFEFSLAINQKLLSVKYLNQNSAKDKFTNFSARIGYLF